MFVYVIQSSDGTVKIGMSADPERRLASLQTGNPHLLRLVHACAIGAGDALAVEADAQTTLQRHAVGGEWFGVPPDVAVAAVERAAFLRRRPEDFGLPSEPVPNLRVAALYAVCLAPMFLFKTPVPFMAFWFVALTIGIVRLKAMRVGLTWGYAYRLIGLYGASTLGSLALALLLYPVAGGTAEMPKIDGDLYCRNFASLAAPALQKDVLDTCRESEATSRIKIGRVWDRVPAAIQETCTASSPITPPLTYGAVANCLALKVGQSWMDGQLRLDPTR